MPTSERLILIQTTPIFKHVSSFCRMVAPQTACRTRTVLHCHKTFIRKHISPHPPMAHLVRSGVFHKHQPARRHPLITIVPALQRSINPRKVPHHSSSRLNIETPEGTQGFRPTWVVLQAQSRSLYGTSRSRPALPPPVIRDGRHLQDHRVMVLSCLSIFRLRLRRRRRSRLEARPPSRSPTGSRIRTMDYSQRPCLHHLQDLLQAVLRRMVALLRQKCDQSTSTVLTLLARPIHHSRTTQM
jgi:hypothetical protein